MKFAKFTFAILFLMSIVSCNRDHKMQESSPDVMISHLAPPSLGTADEEQQLPFQSSEVTDTTTVAAPVPLTSKDWDKKIIKTASLQLEVKNYQAFNNAVRDKIRRYDGYIAQEDNIYTDSRTEVKLAIKVPVAYFENLMNELADSNSTVTERTIRSEDVSEQLVDTRSRLEAKKIMRVKYLEFLKQSKKMSEVLEVQTEINNIQEEIEAAAGRIQYLSRQAAYSTIQLSFFQPVVGFTPNDEPSFFTKALSAFKAGVDFVKYLMLGLITIWPLLIIILISLVLVKKSRRVTVVRPMA